MVAIITTTLLIALVVVFFVDESMIQSRNREIEKLREEIKRLREEEKELRRIRDVVAEEWKDLLLSRQEALSVREEEIARDKKSLVSDWSLWQFLLRGGKPPTKAFPSSSETKEPSCPPTPWEIRGSRLSNKENPGSRVKIC